MPMSIKHHDINLPHIGCPPPPEPLLFSGYHSRPDDLGPIGPRWLLPASLVEGDVLRDMDLPGPLLRNFIYSLLLLDLGCYLTVIFQLPMAVEEQFPTAFSAVFGSADEKVMLIPV